MTELVNWGFLPFFSAQFELLGRPAWTVARVATDGRDSFSLVGCNASFGEPSGKLRQRMAEGRCGRLAVGDWVAITEQGERAVIHQVLDRRTELRRRAAGSDSRSQTIAANVDTYFIVTAAGRDLNPRRIERYLTAVWDSGARPVVLLNKIDQAEDPGAQCRTIEAVAPTVAVLPVSAHGGAGLDALRAQIECGATAAFVGSSGVGKSTLINRLLGEAPLVTGELSADGRGRHTTTRRELFLLRQGGVVIDTPGLREFGILEVGPGLDITFADLASFARDCRFADCSHRQEPGCAVIEAVARGALDAVRLESYRRLRQEAELAEARRDPVLANNAKRRWKSIHKNYRAFVKRERERE